MPIGPGRYDKECETLLKEQNADACMVLVCGGTKGSGFSLSMKHNPAMLAAIITVLRSAADSLEADLNNMAGSGG